MRRNFIELLTKTALRQEKCVEILIECALPQQEI